MWPHIRRGIFDHGRVLYLPVDAIAPNPDQPRQQFAQPELEELADSIRALATLHPLTVRRRNDRWELVATFLAMLELIKAKRITVSDDNQTDYYHSKQKS